MASSAIYLSHLTKTYGKSRGVSDLNLKVEKGEIFGFLGPNGAGKTTTIRCIMDFLHPSSGRISIFGLDSQADAAKVKPKIGFLPADSQLYPRWTGQQHLDFYAQQRGKADIQEVVSQLGLNLNVQARHLSSGNQQKLSLVLALYGDPPLLIMDEPTKGLDPLLQQTIYTILHEYKRRGGTVLVSSHNLPEVEKICDRVGVIKEGQLVASETMQGIRSMSIHLISFSTTQSIKVDDFALNNVTILHHNGKHMLLKVKGDLNQILGVIHRYNLKDLEVNHANLEDIFMEYYR